MSRQQWGHGFYTGLEAAKSEHPKYCVTFTEDGHLMTVYIIQEIHNDLYVLEAIPFVYFLCYGLNEPSKNPIELENVYEVNLNELDNPKLFYSWGSVVRAFIDDEKLYKKENKK